ncbi:MAG: hypothetical protein KY458_11720 [Actinobacteria bacterium]|nr:hypothetical protein [Actinomycetota bacterium]
MTAPGKTPDQVLGVFRDAHSARAAADAAAGVTRRPARTDGAGDEVASLKAEMREELDQSVAGAGNVGPFTKEMTKGIAVGTIIGVIVGMALTLPAALIPLVSSVGVGLRLLIAAIVGGAAGATMGFVAGGGFGAKGPAQPLAAERGTTVAVDVSSADEAAKVAEAMRGHDPIRIDLTTAEGEPVTVVTTEEEELRRST